MPLERIEIKGAPAKAGALSDGGAPIYEVLLWPHRSLPRRGFVWFIGLTFAFLMIPLIPLLGTAVLWGLLPFLMGTLWALWYFLERNYRDARLHERLVLSRESIRVTRTDPRGQVREWQANPYWTRLRLHDKGGPVPNYITLKGAGREIELGAFLSPEERVAPFSVM